MKYVPKKVPEGINSSQDHPLKESFILLAGLVVFSAFVYFALGFVADQIAPRISYEQEVRWFSHLNLFGNSEPKTDEERTEAEKLVGLVDSLWAPYKEETGVSLIAQVISATMPNAFMGPGGQMGVTRGLLSSVESENELAFVICHEIGHFKERHVIRHLGRGLGVIAVLALLGLGAQGDTSLFSAGFDFASLNFSRKQEENADAFALDCMNRRYGHVENYEQFFVKSEDSHRQPGAGKFQVPAYFSTHPLSKDRIQALELEIERRGYKRSGEVVPY